MALAAVGSLIGGCGGTLTLGPSSLPNAVQGTPYLATLGANESGLSWAITGGALPPGLSLDAKGGTISGTATEPTTTPVAFQVTAEDGNSLSPHKGSKSYSIQVLPILAVAANLPSARVGQPYAGPVGITGGVPPYTAQVLGLPGGLSFDASANAVTGTPLFVEVYPLEVTVTDNGSPMQSVSQKVTLIVGPPPITIVTTSLPDGQVDVPYQATLQTDGGSGVAANLSWAVVDNFLPGGLSLDTSSGVISGTPYPDAGGTSTFMVQVTDSPPAEAPDVAVSTLSITIKLPDGGV